MAIPKEPEVPDLISEQIKDLTQVVFLEEQKPIPSDIIFVFGGTHPGHWEKPIEAYHAGLSNKIIVTGGFNPAANHPQWNKEFKIESHGIMHRLIVAGIPPQHIIYEEKSTNTLENVLCAREVFDFETIESVLFICKSYAAGTQYRTLAKHLPNHLLIRPYVFDTEFNGCLVSRDNWFKTETGRKRVWGQYLRICRYGKKGDILPLEYPVKGLEMYS